ncbi:hypothetical protein OSSY52_16340 [Tepiditoga spiralis]|uniref:Aminoglycoside phosphotransferase domain-containing protein n=1 Tax=Tepiditoga spiralis TaxID=2108365 RepID=A0A7G1G974_9BACT|nr:aminoglycoside phosphotransferase family protein [Tepiditoga spiralis]BBE31493.1 hypothetical protein OSSY52_16340 [Tepiditoga spiralis]
MTEYLKQNMKNLYGNKGLSFLKNLNQIISKIEKIKKYKYIKDFKTLSFNYVGLFEKDNEKYAIKIFVPNDEIYGEVFALKNKNLVEIIEYDKNLYCLIEKYAGNKMLLDLNDNKKETEIAAKLLKKLYIKKEYYNDKKLKNIKDMSKNIINFYDILSKDIDKNIIDESIQLFNSLKYEDLYLIHGDFHHFNILINSSPIIIDPKGYLGNIYYEISNYMRNNLKENKEYEIMESLI